MEEYDFDIGDELTQYNMIGVITHLDYENEKLVLYFEETDESIQFDFDEF